MKIQLITKQFRASTLDELLSIIPSLLSELSQSDCDFNGTNGEEYCNYPGFESNLDYAIDCAINYVKHNGYRSNTVENIINNFLITWLYDNDYYFDYEYKVEIADNHQYFIAISYCTRNM